MLGPQGNIARAFQLASEPYSNPLLEMLQKQRRDAERFAPFAMGSGIGGSHTWTEIEADQALLEARAEAEEQRAKHALVTAERDEALRKHAESRAELEALKASVPLTPAQVKTIDQEKIDAEILFAKETANQPNAWKRCASPTTSRLRR